MGGGTPIGQRFWSQHLSVPAFSIEPGAVRLNAAGIGRQLTLPDDDRVMYEIACGDPIG